LIRYKTSYISSLTVENVIKAFLKAIGWRFLLQKFLSKLKIAVKLERYLKTLESTSSGTVDTVITVNASGIYGSLAQLELRQMIFIVPIKNFY